MADGTGDSSLEARIEKLEGEIKKLSEGNRSISIICFSCEYDKLYAAFNLAVGGASMGLDVNVFFTFWAAAAMERYVGAPCKRSFMQKLMGFFLPKDVDSLPLSRMNYLGLGRRMMQSLMRKKNIEGLTPMIESARELGVKFHLCKKSSELIGLEVCSSDDVDACGVGGFISNALKDRFVIFI